MSPGHSPETLTLAADLVMRMNDIAERKAQLDGEYADLRTQLIAAVGLGRLDVADTHVSVTRHRNFSSVTALRVLPPDVIERVSRPVVDRVLARQYLTPEQWTMCVGSDYVSVRLT